MFVTNVGNVRDIFNNEPSCYDTLAEAIEGIKDYIKVYDDFEIDADIDTYTEEQLKAMPYVLFVGAISEDGNDGVFVSWYPFAECE